MGANRAELEAAGQTPGVGRQAASENGRRRGGLEAFVARQGGLWREHKGKLMRGGWAGSSTGFLSLRLQLQVNAELVWGGQPSKPEVS